MVPEIWVRVKRCIKPQEYAGIKKTGGQSNMPRIFCKAGIKWMHQEEADLEKNNCHLRSYSELLLYYQGPI